MRAASIAPAIARDFTPAEPAQHFQRVGKMRLVEFHRAGDRGHLAGQHITGGPRSGPHPVLRRSAIEAVEDRRGDGRVADPHFADAQKIRAARDGFHPEGHRRRACLLVHCRVLRDVGSRKFQREIEDLEPEIVRNADLVDRRAAGREILHHLRRHARRERRDSLFDDTVIAREHRHQRPRHGWRAAGPCSQPFGDFLESPERPGRLGQL